MPVSHRFAIPSEPITGAIHQSAALQPVLAGDGWQTGKHTNGLAAIGMAIDAISNSEHRRGSGGIGAGKINDGFNCQAGDLGGPFGRELHDPF